MTYDEVVAAKAAGQQVSYQGAPVSITKVNPQFIYVTKDGSNQGPIHVTAAELSPL